MAVMPRIIYRLDYTIQRPRGAEVIQVHFRRDGMPRDFKPHDDHGMFGAPCPPKRRTIDLRVGDKIYDFPGWHEILKISVGYEEWVDEVLGDEGFVMGA